MCCRAAQRTDKALIIQDKLNFSHQFTSMPKIILYLCTSQKFYLQQSLSF
ncbi:hypothetical protein FDUTEX481_04655 [Tolypothrix sp. PCC 7601]|nr:hypothetical protein FDUTEX481_04655 [Tolypothrix sp. PCC 7601]